MQNRAGGESVGVEGKARIGIPVPTSNDLEYNAKCWPDYAAAVNDAGGEPVQLLLDGDLGTLRHDVEACSGFLLPGSPADVDPGAYGQLREEGTAPLDAGRQICDRLLLEHVEKTGKPVLGICFGLQYLNVLRGGTLIQNLQPVPVNHGAGASVAVAHSVVVSTECLLGSLLSASEAPPVGEFRRLPVNSSHHQAIGIPADGFAVTARSSQDGVIEALEGKVGPAAVIGVQWHPERSFGSSAASKALFIWLISAAMDYSDQAGAQ
ncbi:MAG: gamma-glutamyl-gamma-aminobutyrate hydrolase family protein [Janthinobacterium lividum]